MTTWDLTSPPGETARLRARVARLQRELGEARVLAHLEAVSPETWVAAALWGVP